MHLLNKEISPSGWSEIDPEKNWRFYISGLPNYLEVQELWGQSAAVSRIARAIQAAELGLNEEGNRPKSSFLL